MCINPLPLNTLRVIYLLLFAFAYAFIAFLMIYFYTVLINSQDFEGWKIIERISLTKFILLFCEFLLNNL